MREIAFYPSSQFFESVIITLPAFKSCARESLEPLSPFVFQFNESRGSFKKLHEGPAARWNGNRHILAESDESIRDHLTIMDFHGVIQKTINIFRPARKFLVNDSVGVIGECVSFLDFCGPSFEYSTGYEGLQECHSAECASKCRWTEFATDYFVSGKAFPNQKRVEPLGHPMRTVLRDCTVQSQFPWQGWLFEVAIHPSPIRCKSLDLEVEPTVLIAPPDRLPSCKGLELTLTQGEHWENPDHPAESCPSQKSKGWNPNQVHVPAVWIDCHRANGWSFPTAGNALDEFENLGCLRGGHHSSFRNGEGLEADANAINTINEQEASQEKASCLGCTQHNAYASWDEYQEGDER